MSHKWQNNGEEWLAWSFCMGYVLLCMGKHRNYHNALFMVIHCFIFPSLIFLVSYSRWSEKKDIGFGKRNTTFIAWGMLLYICCLPLSCLRYSFHLSVLPTSGGVCPFLCSLQCWGSWDKVWWWVMSWRPGVRKRKLIQENLWINCMVWMSIDPKPQFETKNIISNYTYSLRQLIYYKLFILLYCYYLQRFHFSFYITSWKWEKPGFYLWNFLTEKIQCLFQNEVHFQIILRGGDEITIYWFKLSFSMTILW